MTLKEGQTDYRIQVAIDYQDGSQITQLELSQATALEIEYRWKSFEGEDSEKGVWEADGYGEYANGSPYIYYQATSDDAVPQGASRLLGQAKITDSDGLVSIGTTFEIQVLPDDLNA